MFKIKEKIQFSKEDNRMQSIADTKIARERYYSGKSNNVKYLLHKRFSWMNNFIKEDDRGIEVGSGAGFSKDFIKNKTDYINNYKPLINYKILLVIIIFLSFLEWFLRRRYINY